MRFDTKVEFGMMEIDGLMIWIVDGEVDMDSVAMMKDGRIVREGVRDAEGCLQAVCRLEKLSQEPLKFHSVDLVFL